MPYVYTTPTLFCFSYLCDNMIYNFNADLCFEIVLTFQRLTTTPLRPVGLSLRYIIYNMIYNLNIDLVFRLLSSPLCHSMIYKVKRVAYVDV